MRKILGPRLHTFLAPLDKASQRGCLSLAEVESRGIEAHNRSELRFAVDPDVGFFSDLLGRSRCLLLRGPHDPRAATSSPSAHAMIGADAPALGSPPSVGGSGKVAVHRGRPTYAERLEFVTRWKASTRTERAAAQEHFIDICRMLGVKAPNEADPKGEWYAFENPRPTSLARKGTRAGRSRRDSGAASDSARRAPCSASSRRRARPRGGAPLLDEPLKVPTRIRARSENRLHLQVERDLEVAILEARDARLAGPHQLRQRGLREVLPQPERAHRIAQAQLRFDESLLRLGEPEKFAGGADLPAGLLESFLLRP